MAKYPNPKTVKEPLPGIAVLIVAREESPTRDLVTYKINSASGATIQATSAGVTFAGNLRISAQAAFEDYYRLVRNASKIYDQLSKNRGILSEAELCGDQKLHVSVSTKTGQATAWYRNHAYRVKANSKDQAVRQLREHYAAEKKRLSKGASRQAARSN